MGFLSNTITKIPRFTRLKSEVDLISFSPKRISKTNQYIVSQLKKVTSIRNYHDNNIALDGDYGVGKSSIIYDLKSNLWWRIINRPKTISFLSFPVNEKTVDSKELQSEIVRQLYYGERPNKLKGSGYKRIGKQYLAGSFLLGLILGSLIFFRLYGISINAFTSLITNISTNGISLQAPSAISLVWLLIVVLVALAINGLFRLISNGNIKNISAKDLSVELSDDKPDFNQFIDLLIYYFHKTRRRVIIFEDIDRLRNPEIFEELRQLNFILNNRLKIFGTIKFIYATRSDLFSTKATKETGIEKINTKLFDMIIPVVPFLTKVNFSSMFHEEYRKAGLPQKIEGIENILSRRTSDMRVIKAVINNIIAYYNTFELKSDKDYKNIAALSIIRVFAPNDFMKLSTGNSALDFAQEKCLAQKKKSLKEIRERHTPKNEIKNNSNGIWNSIRNIQSLPQDATAQNVVVNGQQTTVKDSFLSDILKIDPNSVLRINWGGYGARNYTARSIQNIIAPFTKEKPLDISEEKELKELAERDCFTFYDDSISFGQEKIDEKALAIVKELLENGFVTEDYARFIAQSDIISADTNIAMRYIYNYIRGKERNPEYALTSKAAKDIMERIDNTDLLSSGVYNYDLFDYIIKNNTEYAEQLSRILGNAKTDIASFMAFADDYCYTYKSELEDESCSGITESGIIELSKSIPPVLLIMKLAKIYPDELMKKITQSALRDTNAKEVIYNIAILNLENPSDLVLEEADRSFLKYYTDSIIKNENGKEILFKLFVANSMPIDNLSIFDVTNDIVNECLDKIIIEINEYNLAILNDDTLISYIVDRKINASNFATLMKSNKEDTKQYIVKNIENCITSDDLPKCIQEAVAYINGNKISLEEKELLQYAGKTNSKNMIRMLILANLERGEIINVMAKCNDNLLDKIQRHNSIIILNPNSHNEKFAKKLEDLCLVKRHVNHKDNKNIRLQVL